MFAFLCATSTWASISQHAARVWSIRNSVSIEDGWRVFSVEFYGDENCMDELLPETYLDGGHYDVNNVHFGPDKAFDHQGFTVWVAQCGKHSKTMRPCAPYEAWVGADFGSPVVVYCVKICQTQLETSSSQITLSKEGTSATADGSLWVDVKTWDGMATSESCVTRTSGINKLSTIAYAAPLTNMHCATNAFGDGYVTYAEARSACDLSTACAGIYDQDCNVMNLDIHFLVTDREKWNRFYANLDSNMMLISSFEDGANVAWRGSIVALEDQARTVADASLPRVVRIDMAAKGVLRLCSNHTNTPSSEGSCLHLKTGALLQFTLEPNTKGTAPAMGMHTTTTVEECAEACVAIAGCESFLYVHKTQGYDIAENNCQLMGIISSKEELDGSIEVADLYSKEIQPDDTSGDGTSTGDKPQDSAYHAATWILLLLF